MADLCSGDGEYPDMITCSINAPSALLSEDPTLCADRMLSSNNTIGCLSVVERLFGEMRTISLCGSFCMAARYCLLTNGRSNSHNSVKSYFDEVAKPATFAQQFCTSSHDECIRRSFITLIIAIDGPAGSGKSSTARTVASRLNALYIDTGAMYRAVALYCLDNNVSAETVVSEITLGLEQSADGVNVFLNGKNVSARIRSQEVSDMSSQVSQIASVRDLMVNQQRALAAKATSEGGTVVMEGRDIGTVVFPSADYKFFLVADPRVRAERRVAQLKEKGEDAEVSTLLSEIIERDKRDEGREHSPLRKASDAIEIDTSGLLFEDQVDKILGVISGNEG